MSQSRLNILVNRSGFNIGAAPFVYLGVPIFKGKPQSLFLQSITDKIILKFASWKGTLLFIARRVELVKSMIHSMLTHLMLIYAWPISLIQRIDKAARNFIWSGDIAKNKVVSVAWKSVCKPLTEGGLGIRNLRVLNEASNLKLGWDLYNSDEPWANLLQSRVL